MVLSRLTKITGPGVATDTNWVGNNADFTGITTTATSFNIGVTTIHSNLIEAHNIKSTGIITATGGSFSGNVTAVDGTFTGNVSIAGTLTYEDVTNIDSVGIITAPAVDVDDFLDVGSNIKLGNAGVITATSFVGSGAALTGIDATAIKDTSGNVKIQAQASGAIHSGVSTFQDIDVDGHTNLDNVSIAGVTTITSAAPELHFTDTNADSDYSIVVNTGQFRIRDETNSANRFAVNSDGHSDFYGRLDANSGLQVTLNATFNNDIDVDGHTNLDNVSVAGVTTITGTLGSSDITITSNQPKLSLTDSSNNPDWSVKNANGNFAINDETAGATRFSINSSNGVEFHMHAVPSADSTYDLGLTGTRWRNVYADTLYGDGSNLTGITGTTINNNANNRIITGSGTANTLEAESSITYDGTKVLNISSSAGGFFQGTDTDGGIGLLEMGNGNVALQADTGNSISNSKIHFFLDGSEKARITSDGRLFVNSTAVANTDDFLTIKRPAGNTSVTSMTLDATTSTGSYANALIFTKAKDYYYNGLVFTSSQGHQGGICGKMTTNGGSTPQIDFRVGGSGFNSSDTLAMTITNSNGRINIGGSVQTANDLNYCRLNIYGQTSQNGTNKNLNLLNVYNYGSGNPGDITGIGLGAAASPDYTKASLAFIRTTSYGRGDLIFCVNSEGNANMVTESDERVRITSNGQIQQLATGGDNQFVTKRTSAAGSNGDYYFHLFANNNSGTNMGALGIVRDTGNDNSRMMFYTANSGTNKERARINRWGGLQLRNIQPPYGSSEPASRYVYSYHRSGTYNTFWVEIRFATAGSYCLDLRMGGYSNRHMHYTFQGYVYAGNDFASAAAIDSGNGPQRYYSNQGAYNTYGTIIRFGFSSMSATHPVVHMDLSYGAAGGDNLAEITNMLWS